ncbi:DUF434 domain-containing protein [Clostridium sp.]|uniref:DUF434 domain-containing protein n=1 Tax=Clostridium sp. TaxID=1506 RepID=UPI0025847EFC|nr:DUF434 domain-containing protein [Clostridium sp.]MDF2506083.1 hypothetical protein [Clostridium sp.]
MDSKLRIVRRGTDPQDDRWFSKEAILKLQKAQEELEWLLNRGYNNKSLMNMIGNHYQFSVRQRNALTRSTSSKEKRNNRKEKCVTLASCKNNCIYIDGFNLIITLEVALSEGILVLCNDGTMRDLAGLRGTYSVIDKTDLALNLIGKELNNTDISKVEIFLELKQQVDSFLYTKERVVTSDSIILDNCKSWLNLGRKIIEDYVYDRNIVDLGGKI